MRNRRFTFLCTQQERDLLAALAARFERSQGDMIRRLIREAASDYGIWPILDDPKKSDLSESEVTTPN